MHWYLWYLGTPERDMVAPFMDELVRRYPDAPIDIANGGARGYDATYVHLVVNWLEIAATSEFIGRERAVAVARAQRQRSYGWLYDKVVQGLGPAGRALRAPRHRADPHAAELRKVNANPWPRRRPESGPMATPGRAARPQRRRAKNARSSPADRVSSIPP